MLAALLNEAAEQRRAVAFVYRSDERPASTHVVRPISSTRRVLRARDLVTGEPRLFLVAYIQLLPDPPVDVPPAKAAPQTDEARLAAAEDELLALGWHVLIAKDRVAVYRAPPRMNPNRLAVVSIFRTVLKKGYGRMGRPWSVLAPGLSRASRFATLDTALDFFMRAAREYAPRGKAR